MKFRGWSYRITPLSICLAFYLMAAQAMCASSFPVTVETRRVVWLERFTQYVEWPREHKVNQKKTPFNLCVLNDLPFFQLVEALLAERSIKGKPVNLFHQNYGDVNDACDVIFIGASDVEQLRELVLWAQPHHVLLISATQGYGARGVHINMYEEDKLQRFEINQKEVMAANLRIDARLLKMGRLVETEVGS